MSIELYCKFLDNEWYKNNINTIVDILTKLPSYIKKVDSDQYWFKAAESENSWQYDVRIFLREQDILFEVAIFNITFHKDVKAFMVRLSQFTEIKMTDADGENFSF